MRKCKLSKNIGFFSSVVMFLSLLLVLGSSMALAKSAKEIDIGVDVALEQFEQDVKGGKEFLKSAKGVLVFPSVIKAGFGIGGLIGALVGGPFAAVTGPLGAAAGGIYG